MLALKIGKIDFVSLLCHLWMVFLYRMSFICIHEGTIAERDIFRKLNRTLTLTCMGTTFWVVISFKDFCSYIPWSFCAHSHIPYLLFALWQFLLTVIITAVVNQLVGWVVILLDKNILRGPPTGVGPYPHHVIGYVLYVAVWILPAEPPVFRYIVVHVIQTTIVAILY